MADKPAGGQKISDIKQPSKTLPTTTSKPVIVTNRPMIATDPMMVADKKPEAEAPSAPDMAGRGKTLQPLDTDLATPSAEPTPADAAASTASPTPAAPVATTEPAAEPVALAATGTPMADQDPEAAAQAAEIAKAEADVARQQEVERLIAEGTYAVRIDSGQRSRMRALLLVLFLVVLAVAVTDVLADADVISLPSSVPHTNFL